MKNLEWKAKVDLIVVMLFCSRNVCTADGKGSFFFDSVQVSYSLRAVEVLF